MVRCMRNIGTVLLIKRIESTLGQLKWIFGMDGVLWYHVINFLG